jgi:hypothetical protein
MYIKNNFLKNLFHIYIYILPRLRESLFGKNDEEIIVEFFYEKNIIIVKDSQSQ